MRPPSGRSPGGPSRGARSRAARPPRRARRRRAAPGGAARAGAPRSPSRPSSSATTRSSSPSPRASHHSTTRRARAPGTISDPRRPRRAADQRRVAVRREQERERSRALGAEAVLVELDRAESPRRRRRRSAAAPSPGAPSARADARRGRRSRSRAPAACAPSGAVGLEPLAARRPGPGRCGAGEPLPPGLAHDRPGPQSIERTRDDRRRVTPSQVRSRVRAAARLRRLGACARPPARRRSAPRAFEAHVLMVARGVRGRKPPGSVVRRSCPG